MLRFDLTAVPDAPERSHLFVLAQEAGAPPSQVVLTRAAGALQRPAGAALLVSARIGWGGGDNPLLAALPDQVGHDATADPALRSLLEVLCAEHDAQRCGAGSVLNRLCEIVIVKLFRALLESGAVQGGALGGLSDPRLGRAIVALHDAPGRAWSNADMAEIAGLSVSRFTDLFRRAVGVTPGAYLRNWRLTLARQDIARGDRIDAVARRYGYGSPEALAHMVRRVVGQSPMALRRQGELQP